MVEVSEAIKTRRSVRGFKPIQIEKERLEKIMEIACRAPSIQNIQS